MGRRKGLAGLFAAIASALCLVLVAVVVGVGVSGSQGPGAPVVNERPEASDASAPASEDDKDASAPSEEPDEEEEPEEAEETEEPEEAEEPEPDVPDESVEEEADNEASEEPEVEETEAVDATTEADEAVNAVDPGTEEEPAVAVPSEQNDQVVEMEQSEPEPDEPAENTEVDPYGDMVERIEAYRPTISFPLSQHRPESICNLVYTIYSRGKLLSKSTGGRFSASKELVETLRSESFITMEEVLEVINELGPRGLYGMTIDEEKVNFDGFPETDSKEKIAAWTALFEAINKTAIRQHHIQAKQVDEENEKFAFRTWLTRLGMNGPELKPERLVLYKNLKGHVAFRTPVDEEKWKARQAAKRQELRARKEMESEETEGSGA